MIRTASIYAIIVIGQDKIIHSHGCLGVERSCYTISLPGKVSDHSKDRGLSLGVKGLWLLCSFILSKVLGATLYLQYCSVFWKAHFKSKKLSLEQLIQGQQAYLSAWISRSEERPPAMFGSHWGLLSCSESKSGLQSIFRTAFKRQWQVVFCADANGLPTYGSMDSDWAKFYCRKWFAD